MHTQNLTLLTDIYELTMMQGYYETNSNENVVFDLYFRNNPNQSGYSVMAGIEQVIEYIKNLNFTPNDISYLESLDLFKPAFLQYLMDFRFTGSIYAFPEGTVIFPREPIVKIIAPIIEGQLIETMLLNIINHQCLIATKASRIVYAAGEDSVIEFGLRRAQGSSAGIYGARAAMIGGCSGTSNVLAGKLFDVPLLGTHAHSWVMNFKDEYTAFKEYSKLYPNRCIFLVDTYDTLKSGLPNAIRVFKELSLQGKIPKLYGIRLDSGDLAYLSKQARKMLDEAGLEDAIITASNDLDEILIHDLKNQGAKVNAWGVGTNMITSKDCPAFGGVYKLTAIQNEEGLYVPKVKISENLDKITDPGNKTVFRIYDKETNKIKADLVCFADENFDAGEDLLIFDPNATWKKTLLIGGTYEMKELLVPIFIDGECVYQSPTVMEIAKYCRKEKETLWDETKRLFFPHRVYVDLSQKLYDTKRKLLEEHSKGVNI
jgi:nicotinate phosphoribosyltransferase